MDIKSKTIIIGGYEVELTWFGYHHIEIGCDAPYDDCKCCECCGECPGGDV